MLITLSPADPRPGESAINTEGLRVISYYAESPLTPSDTNANRQIDGDGKAVESPSIIQLARDRLRRSFD